MAQSECYVGAIRKAASIAKLAGYQTLEILGHRCRNVCVACDWRLAWKCIKPMLVISTILRCTYVALSLYESGGTVD